MKKFLFIILFVFNALSLYCDDYVCFSSNNEMGKSIFLFQVKKDEINVVSDSTFSLSDSVKVRFVNGNLMRRIVNGDTIWSIAKRQFDFVGGNYNGDKDLHKGQYGTIWESINGNLLRSSNDSINIASYKGWIDLFPYGTGELHSKDIINDGEYKTPSQDEYDYLFYKRPNAANLRGRARIKIPGNNATDTIVNGVILMPDNWDPSILPNNVFKSDSAGCWYYYDNVYSLVEWQLLESNGAIFLPAAGSTGSKKYNRSGFYWTAKSRTSLEFGGYPYTQNSIPQNATPSFVTATNSDGRAIRLVQIIKTNQ